MKVVHLINTLSAGGAELHLLTLCRHLKRRGLDLKIICLRDQVKGSRSLRADFEQEQISVTDLQANSRYDWRFIPTFVRLLKKERPEILHAHLPRADLAAMFGRLFYPDAAWVSSVHGVYEDFWSGRWTLPLFDNIWRQADSIVAISFAVRNWLVTIRGVPTSKIEVIHYGVDTDRFRRPGSGLRQKSSGSSGPVLGSIGRLEPGKGHDCLIESMPAVLKRLSNARLLIAGHDPWDYGKTLKAIITRLGLDQHVELVGFQKDVTAFPDSLDVFAFASRSEGFGQVVIEAMAAGKPTVTSRIPALAEIVLEGETGLLAETNDAAAFADAIVWFLTHPDQAADGRTRSATGRESLFR